MPSYPSQQSPWPAPTGPALPPPSGAPAGSPTASVPVDPTEPVQWRTATTASGTTPDAISDPTATTVAAASAIGGYDTEPVPRRARRRVVMAGVPMLIAAAVGVAVATNQNGSDQADPKPSVLDSPVVTASTRPPTTTASSPTTTPTTAAPTTSAPTTAPSTAPVTIAPSTAPAVTTTATTLAPTTTTAAGPSCTASVPEAQTKASDVVVSVASNVANAPVVVTMRFRTTNAVHTARTDAAGNASTSYFIGTATRNYEIVIDVKVGDSATCSTSVTPI
ncbi:MAG: hypothetical protein AB7L13_18695 [Acidimicrobiia bacterium]